MLSLYLTRFDIFEFKLTDNLLQKLKKRRINKKGRDLKRYIKESFDNYQCYNKEKKIELDLQQSLHRISNKYTTFLSKLLPEKKKDFVKKIFRTKDKFRTFLVFISK